MPEPVPVLFLLPSLAIGGAERQVAALARSLTPERYRVIVSAQHALGPVADELRAAGIPVHLLSGRARFDPAFLGRVRRLIRREGVRVVLTHGFSTGVAGRLAGVLGGAPVRVLAEHSTGERDMSRGRHLVNRLLAPLVSAWVALADGQLEYLARDKGIPRERTRIIPNGIDPAPFAPAGGRERIRRELGISEDAPVAGILAVLRPEKDHKNFLLAARFVADELPEARFLVVGDGPLAVDLAREAAVLELDDRVTLTGRRDDVADVLAAFDVSVLCSTDVETFPLAFLESMATGLPLIGSRVGGLPDMIEEERNGLLVRPRDPRGLADAMLRILRDRPLGREWGARSRARVESDLSLERMVRAYEDLFEELLTRAGVPVSPGRSGDGG